MTQVEFSDIVDVVLHKNASGIAVEVKNGYAVRESNTTPPTSTGF
ncbi:hypothetical protein [Mycolicibacterium sp. OfavD-34-C]|nr:hypothetical protein [Mycolicibacterium sp. OfavD-34-C]